MASKMTPPYGVSGHWKLRSPFVAKAGKIYSCKEIRSFSMLQLQGVNVYESYYMPRELSKDIYEADSKVYASIVTLLGSDGERIYVPDTYIDSYPDVSGDVFKRFILSCDLGTLPGNTDVSHLIPKVSDAVEGALGRKPTVLTHIAPLKTDDLTPTERTREETNRLSSVRDTSTTYGQLQKMTVDYGNLQAYCLALQQQLASGEKALTDNSVANQRALEEKKREYDKLNDKYGQLQTKDANNERLITSLQKRIKVLENKITSSGLTIPE